VKMAFEFYATGEYSIARLQATMADLGLTTRPTKRWPKMPITENTLYEMLKEPYYAGYVKYKGELYDGRHEPLISRELHQRVQDVMSERAKAGTRDMVHKHYLKGILFCHRCYERGVTSWLIYTEAKGKGGVYKYYFCRSRQTKTTHRV